MNKLKNIIGMTLAEVLIVIGIIAVLGGVASVAVWNYQRSLGQLERDGIAKEIFVAAQNHLTAAYGAGYLGLKEPESNLVPNPFGTKASDGAYYYVVNSSDPSYSTPAVFEQMLPFGSIDETVRTGGSYIVRYQKDTGTVLDVFYCSRNGSPTQYNHILGSGEYTTVMELTGDSKKSDRRTYKNGGDSILGWYGGTEAATLATIKLKAPSIEIENRDKLKVKVTDSSSNGTDYEGKYSLKLIITGEQSHAQKSYTLLISSGSGEIPEVTRLETGTAYTIILDDITTSGLHFCEIQGETNEPNATPENPRKINFIPGENITVQAVAYSIKELANVAYSTEKKTNSLFADGTTTTTAQISSMRHLENLDATISNLDANDLSGKLNISSAEQANDLNWAIFNSIPVTIYGYNGSSSKELTTTAGNYYPIEPDYPLSYDGKSHSISGVVVNSAQISSSYARVNAGLFGSVSKVSAINNLELIDFSITGTTCAGALAGTLEDCTVTNVLARNSAGASTAKITASGTDSNAGGLIGNLVSGTIQYSAAAVLVGDSTTKPTNAGGLIGSASGQIINCYSGGHTKNGSYEEWVEGNAHPYDVTGGTAGGLVGSSSASISGSYSTCSVSGTTAGGFAGSASGSIENCYATGLVEGTTKYAFLASDPPATFTGNYYYRVINEVEKAQDGKTVTEPMKPYPSAGEVISHLSKMKPIDLNADSYNTFVGAWDNWNLARAFDSALVKYYSGKYPLRAVQQLPIPEDGAKSKTSDYFVSTHYGDWPSPEVFFINE